MAKNPALEEELPPNIQDREFTEAEIARYERLFAQRAAEKLQDERRAARLRWRHVVLKFVGGTPGTYPLGACTAHDPSVPEGLRCNGNHEFIAHGEVVYLGDFVEQWPGHRADLSDFLEMEVD